MNQSENTSPKLEQKEVQQEKEHLSERGSQKKRLYPGGVRENKKGNNFRYPVSTKSRTGVSWQCMMNRCYNKNVKDYKWYGGIGIFVCSRIQKGPQELVGLIGIRPENKTVDRIDGRKSYTCGECQECKSDGCKMNIRWATRTEQRRNQPRNRFITINGVTKTAMEWANKFGIKWSTLYQRIGKGWSGDKLFSRILSPQEGRNKRSFTINGITKTLSEWVKESGLKLGTVTQRIDRGWTIEQALKYPANTSQRICELEKKNS